MIKSLYRGHTIIYEHNKWLYGDNKQAVANNTERACGYCGKKNTEEGHDGCIGTLKGVMNACCGHGDSDEAYVQFWDGNRISGIDALEYILPQNTKANSVNAK